MSVYLRTADGERVLLDTAKCKLVYEETEYDLTGATLDFYDAPVTILDGTIGSDRTPCKVERIEDTFTGLRVEVPLPGDSPEQIAKALHPRERSFHRLLRQH